MVERRTPPALAIIAATPLLLTACGWLVPKAAHTTLDLLRQGSDKVCVAADVHAQLGKLILPKLADVPGDVPSEDKLAALKTVSLSYASTTLQALDKTINKASCSSNVHVQGTGGTARTFPVAYAVSPSAESDTAVVVTADTAEARDFAANLIAGAIADTGGGARPALPTSATSVPAVTAAWLVGTWGPEDTGGSDKACDTENVVTFAADGTYTDGEGHGRYRSDGSTITYYGRVLVDEGDDTEDRSQFDQPRVTHVTALSDRSLREDGDTLYRCKGD